MVKRAGAPPAALNDGKGTRDIQYFFCSSVDHSRTSCIGRSKAVLAHHKLEYDRLGGSRSVAPSQKSIGGIVARVEITFAVYRPPRDDLPHLVVVLADGRVLLSEPAESFDDGEKLVDHLSRELLKISPPRD